MESSRDSEVRAILEEMRREGRGLLDALDAGEIKGCEVFRAHAGDRVEASEKCVWLKLGGD